MRRRLVWSEQDRPAPDTRSEWAGVARVGAYAYAGGGTLGLLALSLPHPEIDETGVLAVTVAAFMTAAILMIGFDRLPAWAYRLESPLGTLYITLGLYFTARGASALVILYVPVVLSASYLQGRAWAVAQSAWVGVAYGTLLLIQRPAGAAGYWVITVGMLTLAGNLMGRVWERVERLVGQLADAARTDPLTGLLNRRGFEEQLELELERCRRGGRPLALVIGDLDHFKQVNDRLGHHAGDQALERLGSLMTRSKRRIDIAARMGGEEFALVLPDTDEHGAYTLAERLRDEVRRAFDAEPLALTISLGIAGHPNHGENAESLLHAADQALYSAKELGRDRAVIHSPDAARAAATIGGRESERSHLATVLALAETLDVRYGGTAHHSQAVGHYAELAARELGLPPEVVERVRIAGIVHDVGRVGAPDSVMNKPGALSDDEWEVVRKHPEIGARILEGAGLYDIGSWVLAHQERLDGHGYPRGLTGPAIPLEARILAVADAYEAMTSEREYRPALSHEAARIELMQCAGTQFDPQVVDAFLRLLERRGAEIRSRSVA